MVLSAVMILGGAGAMAAGMMKSQYALVRRCSRCGSVCTRRKSEGEPL